jgi:hypothetical protein
MHGIYTRRVHSTPFLDGRGAPRKGYYALSLMYTTSIYAMYY